MAAFLYEASLVKYPIKQFPYIFEVP